MFPDIQNLEKDVLTMKRKIFAIVLVLALSAGSFAEGGAAYMVAAAAAVKINPDNFYDEEFRNYLTNHVDMNKDGSLSSEEINNVTSIDISGTGIKMLSGQTGIGIFTNLRELNISGTTVSNLDLSKNTKLQVLNCSNTGVTKLNLSTITGLTSLTCDGLNITSLDLSANTALENLSCSNTKLTNLDISKNSSLKTVVCKGGTSADRQLDGIILPKDASLEKLDCSNNQIARLDLSGVTKLVSVNAENNGIQSIDVSSIEGLTSLNLDNNNIQVLDVSKASSLTSLSVYNNPELKTLTLNGRLIYLNCSSTGLSELDFRSCKAITELYCANNNIEKLELATLKNLSYLSCYNNPLDYLSLAENALEKGLNNGNLHIFSSDTIINSDSESNVSIGSGTEKSGFIAYEPKAVKTVSLTDVGAIGIVSYKYKNEDIRLQIVGIGYEAGDVKASADCQHIFRDYTHKMPMAETSIRVYGNAVTIKNKDGQKVNKKTAVLYTDIKPSYIYTEKKGKVTAKTGKVIVGLTMTDKKPVVTKKNKIEDEQASNIARASIKSGMITINATGKGSGVVYLWVIDTGADGECEVCPINVAMAPRKIQAKDKAYNDPSGTLLKNPKFDAGTKLNIFLNPVGGDGNATGDCTYTVELDSKSQSIAELTENTEGEYGYTITSKNASAKKKSKVTLKITCDQSGRTFKWYATIVPVKEDPVEEKKV